MNTTPNANEPAYPGEIEVASTDPLILRPIQTGPRRYKSAGLTKREAFALAAMQGILASGHSDPTTAGRAIWHADALLAELEKTA